MPSPSVSVVIPAYNAAATVEAALASVFLQGTTSVEAIVVDDGSQDGTADLACALAARWPIRVIQQANAGVCAARNAGIARVETGLVAFLDADDIWLPDKLQRSVEALDADPAARAVQTGVLLVDGALQVLGERRCLAPRLDYYEALLFRGMPGLMSTLIMESTLIRELGGFDTSLSILEDWDLALRIVAVSEMRCLDEPLTLYRQHEGNRSANLEIHVAPGLQVLDRVFSDARTPKRIRGRRRRIYSAFYSMLMGSAFRNRQWRAVAGWGAKAVVADPRALGYMAALPLRAIGRQRTRRGTFRPASGSANRH